MTDHTVDKVALATGAHFNKLTPAEAERLAMLAEECGEVIQVIGKILQHGYDSYHPVNPRVTNRGLLVKELRDVNAVLQAMGRSELQDYSVQDCLGVWERKLRYSHHQEDCSPRPEVTK